MTGLRSTVILICLVYVLLTLLPALRARHG